MQESESNGINLSDDSRTKDIPIYGYPDIRQVTGSPVHDVNILLTSESPRSQKMVGDSKILLPRTGEIKDDRCGELKNMGVCSSNPDHARIPIRHSCNRLECPVCYGRPLLRAAEASAQRIQGYQSALGQARLLDLTGSAILPPRHFMISPPALIVNKCIDRTWKTIEAHYWHPDDWGKVFISKFRHEAYKALQVADLEGGGFVAHLYRIRSELLGTITAATKRFGLKDRWEYVLNRSDWRDLIYFSPHAHFPAYGTTVPTNQFYEVSGGWTIRMIREASTVQGLMYYLLSHAPVINGRLSITYLGCLCPQRLRCTEIRTEKEEMLCPECGAVMVIASCDDEGELLEIHMEQPLVRRKKIRYYTLCTECGFKKTYKPLKRIRRTYA